MNEKELNRRQNGITVTATAYFQSEKASYEKSFEVRVYQSWIYTFKIKRLGENHTPYIAHSIDGMELASLLFNAKNSEEGIFRLNMNPLMKFDGITFYLEFSKEDTLILYNYVNDYFL